LIEGAKDVQGLKAAFSSLLKSIAQEMLALVIKEIILLIITRALKAALGGGGGGIDISGFLAGGTATGAGIPTVSGYADGGPVTGGRPILVGERGPELWTPPSAGTITSNRELVGALPEVNVRVVNVLTERDLAGALVGAEGEKVVVNHMVRNSKKINQMSA
jgi:hypothetical protein